MVVELPLVGHPGRVVVVGELGLRVGRVATVWDGEVAGLERGIQAAGSREWKIILLTD